MKFILIARDKPGTLGLRLSTRPAHLAYWQHQSSAAPRFGGPLLGPDGNPCGSVLVVEATSLAEAEAIFNADPYVKGGLFATADINAFRHVFTDGKLVE